MWTAHEGADYFAVSLFQSVELFREYFQQNAVSKSPWAQKNEVLKKHTISYTRCNSKLLTFQEASVTLYQYYYLGSFHAEKIISS